MGRTDIEESAMDRTRHSKTRWLTPWIGCLSMILAGVGPCSPPPIDLCSRPDGELAPHVIAWENAERTALNPIRFDGTEVAVLALGVYAADETPTRTRDDLEAFLNQDGYGATLSVSEFFRTASGGQMRLRFVVPPLVRLPKPLDSYDVRFGLFREALAEFGASSFDRTTLSIDPATGHYYPPIIFKVSEREFGSASSLSVTWPSLPSQTRDRCESGDDAPCFRRPLDLPLVEGRRPAGVIFHELGHSYFGWPELYADPTAPFGHGNSGIGGFGPMSGGVRVPYNPLFRQILAWGRTIDIDDLPVGTRVILAKNRQITLRHRGASKPDEYFLIEPVERGRAWYPEAPDEGLWIWHIDGSQHYERSRFPVQFVENTPSRHNAVSVEQADGEFGVENVLADGGGPGDAFKPGDSFTGGSLPSSRWWDGSDSGLAISQIEDRGESFSFVLGDEDTVPVREAYALRCGAPLVEANPAVRATTAQGDPAEFRVSNIQTFIQTITPTESGRLNEVSFVRRDATELRPGQLQVSVRDIDGSGRPMGPTRGAPVRVRTRPGHETTERSSADLHSRGISVQAGVPIGIVFSNSGRVERGHVLAGSLQAGGNDPLFTMRDDNVTAQRAEGSLSLSWTIVPDRQLSAGESRPGPEYLEPPGGETGVAVHAQQDVVQRVTARSHGILERIVLPGRVRGGTNRRPLHLEISDPADQGPDRILVRHTVLIGELDAGPLEVTVLDQAAVVHAGQELDVRLWTDASPSAPAFEWEAGDRGDRYADGEARVRDRVKGVERVLPNDQLFSLTLRR